MEQHENQVDEIIKLNTAVRELSAEVKSLRREVKQLQTKSVANQQRCDYLENTCSRLKVRNTRLVQMLKSSRALLHSGLDPTISLDDGEVNADVRAITPTNATPDCGDRRILSRMSDDFRDISDETSDEEMSDSHDEKETEEYPELFDVETFNQDGSSLSYEDSDESRGSDGNSEDVESSDQAVTTKVSRLNWFRRKFRNNKISPV